MIGICEDVTNRKVVDEALRSTADRLQQQQERFSFATTAGGVGYWFCDLPFAELIWDHCVKEHFWLPPDTRVTIEIFYAVIHPDDREPTRQAIEASIASRTTYDTVYRTVAPDGNFKWIRAIGRTGYGDDGTPVRFDGITIDITHQRRSEQALVRNEKLAAVGRLASTMAHEINNPLEAVTNLVYLSRQAKTVDEAAPFLTGADIELRRVSAIVSRTLRFHRQASKPVSVTFGQFLEGIFVGQHNRLSNSHVAVSERDRSTLPVICLEGEIRQVLVNLVGNAIDAMHGRGGILFVRGRDGKNWVTGRAGLIITIADTGTGMSEATKGRAFEAFFSTKGIGGTGLGLWVSKEIVDRHQGPPTA